MIEFRNVSKHFGTQQVLDGASFRINEAERIGITGPNGSGKSTLFGLICGDIEADQGDVWLQARLRIGHLRQQLNAHDQNRSLLTYVCDTMPELKAIRLRIHEVEHALPEADEESKATLLNELGQLQTHLEHLGAYDLQTRAETTLCGLGFNASELESPFTTFSGGWQMRAELARVLISEPDVLLLDEPSNYLDIPAVEWLQKFIRAFQGTLLLISHDRYLLETLTNVTLEMAGGRVTRYPGNYSYYRRERTARAEQLQAAARNQAQKREHLERFVERFRSKATKATQVQSRIKMLERMDDIDMQPETPAFSGLRLPAPPDSGTESLAFHGVCFGYPEQERPLFEGLDFSMQRGDKVALIGYNGMGKTTLMRLMAGKLEPSGGKRRLGHHVVIGYQSQEFAETMPPERSLFNVIKDAHAAISDADARGLLGSFGFGGDAVHKTVAVLSGGEKIRLAFARIFANPPNMLLLDEPTTHLDIDSRRALEKALSAYAGTVCIVSHDIEFIRHVATQILSLTEEGLERYCGGYDYYREKSGQSGFSSGGAADADTLQRKEQRKERGRQREADKARLRTLNKAVNQAEKMIEKLETERDTLVEQLSSGEEVDYATLNKRLADIQQELEKQNDVWEKSALELETIEVY
ncbi:MAG: ABC transporter ATP-binding protein [Spartobacteria bacterium]|nr:ABC transporter ATP-binding protein [Spartobacteria bacterium]